MFVAGNEVDAAEPGYLLMFPLGITTGRNNQSPRVLATGQPQVLAAFAVGNMGNRAGIENVDISRTIGSYDTVTGISKLPGQKLSIGLIELAADCIQGNIYSSPSCYHLIVLNPGGEIPSKP
jgi:hypothetical protein